MTGSDLKDRITMLSLENGGDGWAWVPGVPTWAKVEQSSRRNLFSTVGIGARGVVLTIRKRPIDLQRAIRWHGHHIFLTAIREACPGFLEVEGALAEPERMTARRQAGEGRDDLNRPVLQEREAVRFPGILAEEYRREDRDGLHTVTEERLVLVAPKAVLLRPGDLVQRDGQPPYTVAQALTLDPYRNEYIITRQVDV